jgi:hypothetical protein
MQGYLPCMWGKYGPVTGDVSRESDVGIKGSSRVCGQQEPCMPPRNETLPLWVLSRARARRKGMLQKRRRGGRVLPREADRVELCLCQPVTAWQLSILRITYGYSYKEEAQKHHRRCLSRCTRQFIIESTPLGRPSHQQIYDFKEPV